MYLRCARPSIACHTRSRLASWRCSVSRPRLPSLVASAALPSTQAVAIRPSSRSGCRPPARAPGIQPRAAPNEDDRHAPPPRPAQQITAECMWRWQRRAGVGEIVNAFAEQPVSGSSTVVRGSAVRVRNARLVPGAQNSARPARRPNWMGEKPRLRRLGGRPPKASLGRSGRSHCRYCRAWRRSFDDVPLGGQTGFATGWIGGQRLSGDQTRRGSESQPGRKGRHSLGSSALAANTSRLAA